MWLGTAAALTAAAAAGPWPGALPGSLWWRAPLVVAALAVMWRAATRGRELLAIPPLLALLVEAFLPAARVSPRVAQRLSQRVAEVHQALADAAEREDVRRLFLTEGGTVDPNLPFASVEQLARSLPIALDTVVLADERGEPVAWAGPAARLPVRLRLLGEPVVAAEAGFRCVNLWWRVPVFDQGRPVGALLATSGWPEDGARRVLGVWMGRAAVALPLLDGGSPVLGPGKGRVVGVQVHRASAVWWSTAGVAAAASILIISATTPLRLGYAAAATAAVWLVGVGRLESSWWVVLALLGLAWVVHRVGAVGLGAAAVVIVGGVAYLLPGVMAELPMPSEPGSLLFPGPVVVSLAVALTVLFGALPAGGAQWWRWVLRVGGWTLMLASLVRGEHPLLAAGAAMAALGGLPFAGFAVAGVLASITLLVSWEVMRKDTIVSRTETTLALVENAESPARLFLSSMPEGALEQLAGLGPNESLVVLGRAADWYGLEDRLPGTALALDDGAGRRITVWGPAPPPGSAERILARRDLGTKGSLSIIAPEAPQDVLESVVSAGIGAPVAVFGRSGAPHSRGATFRPLEPEVVGRALAATRSWSKVGVGEREFLSYLRARSYSRTRGDSVLAVPWIRPPRAQTALMMAALSLWGALPLSVWRQRARWREWWAERTTFVGRTRILTAATTLVPVLLLGQLLPGQWLREQERARLEFGRALTGAFQRGEWETSAAWLAQEQGGAVAVYRGGRLVASSRPDLVVRGEMPAMPPRVAYVRAIRGWGEPLVEGEGRVRMFVALGAEEVPSVLGIIGISAAGVVGGPSPVEWFAVTGVLALLGSLAAAERLGRRLALPLRRVVLAAGRLERGEPFEGLPESRDEDVGALGRAFGAMAQTVQRREEELRRERDLLEMVLKTLSAGVLVSSPDLQVELANPAADGLLRGSRDVEALGSRFGPTAVSLVAAGVPTEQIVHPPGDPEGVWRITVLPLAASVGRTLVVMEDLSELARAERLASLAELARIVAHEVKNPLTPIRLWAEELQAALATDSGRVVETARLAAEHILERVEHLRQVAQGFSNLVGLERWNSERVDLGETAAAVVREYDVLAQRGIRVHLDARPGVVVAVDPEWARRAVRHLLENSARALSGRAGTIAVTVDVRDKLGLLVVRDSGGGVTPQNLPRLFEPFFSTTSEGSGLGLAVVRRVAERAGGWAEARNVDGGLEVTLAFPIGDGASSGVAGGGSA